MAGRRIKPGRFGLHFLTLIWLAVLVPLSVAAAPYAALVMDARSGKVLHARNADTRLHPASLTKMMTLYIAFEAVQNGEISMDTLVTVSAKAASEPPSKLGLRKGQKIKLRYLVRAAAVKSANDAATAIGEAIAGSEAAFARRMNRTAQSIGMTRTTFKNAHGLTESGHLSTARDMSILGRHVLYDYPMYYNLFSRRTADAGVRQVSHTNRRLLDSYAGADGIKTGYTRAAGFNLVASAERGNERIIATVFGGRSTASRNAKVAELLDMGFRRAPSRVALRKPGRPPYLGNRGTAKTVTVAKATTTQRGKSLRVANAAVTRSLRPAARPVSPATYGVAAVIKDDLKELLTEAQKVELPETETDQAAVIAAVAAAAEAPAVAPPARAAAPAAAALAATPKPAARPRNLVLASLPADAVSRPKKAVATPEPEPEVVTRLSTSGGRHWGINVGRYPSRYQAEKVLLRTALAEMATLDGALRKVVSRSAGHDANFMGLTREMADLACRRLQARQTTCFMIGPN